MTKNCEKKNCDGKNTGEICDEKIKRKNVTKNVKQKFAKQVMSNVTHFVSIAKNWKMRVSNWETDWVKDKGSVCPALLV